MEMQRPEPQHLVGTWRRFGQTGPVYEILSSPDLHSGDAGLMRIRVLESGEELNYSLREILDDPKER